SSSLPILDIEDDEDLMIEQPISPSQPLLALPGADLDDTLLPALDWEIGRSEMPSYPSSSGLSPDSDISTPFSSLIIFFDEAFTCSSSPELEYSNLFDIDISAYKCPHANDTDRPLNSTCKCTLELAGLSRLCSQYLRAEREARNAEGKMK